MRLLKTHSYTSERPGYMKPGKTRRKLIEGNADTIIRQTTRQKPAAYRQCGGRGEKKKAPWQDNPPSKSSRVPSAWRGGETKKGELKENPGAKARETNIKTLPQATVVAGGRDEKARIKHEMERRHNHSPARGGKCLAENA